MHKTNIPTIRLEMLIQTISIVPERSGVSAGLSDICFEMVGTVKLLISLLILRPDILKCGKYYSLT